MQMIQNLKTSEIQDTSCPEYFKYGMLNLYYSVPKVIIHKKILHFLAKCNFSQKHGCHSFGNLWRSASPTHWRTRMIEGHSVPRKDMQHESPKGTHSKYNYMHNSKYVNASSRVGETYPYVFTKEWQSCRECFGSKITFWLKSAKFTYLWWLLGHCELLLSLLFSYDRPFPKHGGGIWEK